MKVAFNSLPLKTEHKTRGIGFYTRNLLADLLQRPDIEIQEFSDISEIKKVDVVHYPFFDLFLRSLPIIKKFPTIVTIHDVIPLIFPRHYPPGIKGFLNNLYQKMALKNVSAIITDSENSKKDIQKFLKVDDGKIFPVYLAPADYFRPIKDKKRLESVSLKYHLPNKFAFYVGSVNWNKNLLNMTAACVKADIDLVLAGKDFEDKLNLYHPEKRSYAEFLKKFESHSKVHILGFIPDEDLAVIMNLSKVILLPSFYEGFGLPILEAQACGTPVITSNVSSMPEIAGKGTILVDPNSVGEIAQAIREIINDQKSRKNLIDKGLENIQRFSWEKTIKETIKVYQYAVCTK